MFGTSPGISSFLLVWLPKENNVSAVQCSARHFEMMGQPKLQPGDTDPQSNTFLRGGSKSEDEPLIVFSLEAQWGRLKPYCSAAACYPGGCGLVGHQPRQRPGLAPTSAGRWLWVDLGTRKGKGWRRKRSTGAVADEINLGGSEERQLGAAARCSPSQLLPWPDLGVPTASPHPRGVCAGCARQ